MNQSFEGLKTLLDKHGPAALRQAVVGLPLNALLELAMQGCKTLNDQLNLQGQWLAENAQPLSP